MKIYKTRKQLMQKYGKTYPTIKKMIERGEVIKFFSVDGKGVEKLVGYGDIEEIQRYIISQNNKKE